VLFHTISIFLLVSLNSLITTSWPAKENENMEFEFLQEIEKQRLKEMIAKELDELPHSSIASTTMQLPNGAIRLLLPQKKDKQTPKPNHQKIELLHPNNQDIGCQKTQEESCRRFVYNISPKTIFATSEFMVHRIKWLPNENPSISVLCSHEGEGGEDLLEKRKIVVDKYEDEWVSLHLPSLQKLEISTVDITCAIEVTGMVIHEDGDDQPLLKLIQELDTYSRNKRSIAKTNNSESCRLIPFKTSFREIGLDSIVFPESFENVLCVGYCSAETTVYELFAKHAFKTNDTLREEVVGCGFSCCKPKSFKPLDVLYEIDIENSSDADIKKYGLMTLQNAIVSDCTCD